MDRWRGKNAVITGVNSGIGKAIALSLAENGIHVVGLDVETDQFDTIRETSKGGFHGLQCDISDGDQLEQTFFFMKNQLNYDIDILVNAAGVADYYPIIDSDRKRFEKLLNINVLAVATCIRNAVESMRNRGVEGHIFNINSILGHEIPLNGLSNKKGSNSFNLYPACKHATVAMTHSVRRELAEAKLQVRITSISPGLVKTNITKNTSLSNFFDNTPALEANDIAGAVIYALSTRPDVQISELTIRRTGEP